MGNKRGLGQTKKYVQDHADLVDGGVDAHLFVDGERVFRAGAVIVVQSFFAGAVAVAFFLVFFAEELLGF